MQINKLPKTIISILIIFIVILIYIIFMPNSFSSSSKIIDINKGMSTRDIAVLLKNEKLIKSTLFFKIVYYIRKGSLKAGQYELNTNMNLWKVVGILKIGRVKLYKIIIPEGFTLKQIAELLEANKLIDGKKFIELSYNKDTIEKFKIKSKSLEGFLFPDTYYLRKGIKEEDILSLMIKRFNKIIEKNNICELAKQKKTNLNDLIKLASLVEKEAKLNSEKVVIASIFLKRLKSRMKLESCATVLYVFNNVFEKSKTYLLDTDLKINSDFNTYLHYGLPPTPICNPGLSSILAVLNSIDTNYLYFVSKKDGTHEFSTTLEEHLKAKRRLK